jgi:sRNA-binding protein
MSESTKANILRLQAQLTERWPELFNLQKPLPLAIGIREALVETLPDFTEKTISRFLASWCKRPRYLAALTANSNRFGLTGAQGTVTLEQATLAAERLNIVRESINKKHSPPKKIQQVKVKQAAPARWSPPKPRPTKPTMIPIVKKKRRFSKITTSSF